MQDYFLIQKFLFPHLINVLHVYAQMSMTEFNVNCQLQCMSHSGLCLLKFKKNLKKTKY